MNHHKLSSLKKNIRLLCHHFYGSRIWSWLHRIPCSRSRKAAVKVSAGLHFHLEAWQRKNTLPDSFKVGRINFLAFVGLEAPIPTGHQVEAVLQSYWPPAVPWHVVLSICSHNITGHFFKVKSLPLQSANLPYKICHTEWSSQKEKNKYHILTHTCGI